MTPAAAAPSPSDFPLRFSLVVNTCDRQDGLRTLLYGLEHQSWPHFEVVVVIGPTTDDSRGMVAAEFPERVRVVDCPEFNLSVSRNLGVAHAAGDVVAFVDDDAVPCPTWLEQLAEVYLTRPDVAGVGGRTYHVRPEAGDLQFLQGLFSVVAEQDDVRPAGAPPPSWATPPHLWFPRFHGTNMSYRRSALQALGGFDERYEYLFDDADIGVRLGRAGFELAQSAQAIVYHAPASGRNRGTARYDLNWYSWLRSTIYFALKNGSPSLGWRASAAAALRHAARLSGQVRALAQAGEMTAAQHRRARRMFRQAVLHGFWQGLVRPRRLPAQVPAPHQPFVPFPRAARRLPPVSPLGFPPSGGWSPVSEPPLSVCLLSLDYPPRNTHGVARSTQTLARGLAELGCEVHVVTHGEQPRVRHVDGAYVREVNGFGRGRYGALERAGMVNTAAWLAHGHAAWEEVRAIRQNHRLDVVDSPLWQLDGLVTRLAEELPVVVRPVTAMKQIASVHGRENAETQLLGELEGELLTRAHGIASNSEATARTLEQVYGLDLTQHLHTVVYYGMVPAPDDQVPGFRANDEPVVLFVGRLEGRKGVMDLFAALPAVLAAQPRARFVFAGSDNSREDGFFAREGVDYPTWFRKHHARWAEQVEFLGFVSEERLDTLYREADVFVAPSLYESFGLIFLEAMNYAKPTVGCRAGGPQEIIADGETGLLVPPQDPAALADAILRLVADAELRRRLGAAGRTRLLERFTHLTMARGFLDFYRRVAAKP